MDPFTLIALASTAISAGAQVYSAKKQNQAIRASNRAAKLQADRERRQAIRQQIRQQAEMRAGAQVLGLGQSSALAGGVASVSSQTGSNIGFGTQLSGINQQIANLQGQAQSGLAVAGIAEQIGSPQTMNTLKSLF